VSTELVQLDINSESDGDFSTKDLVKETAGDAATQIATSSTVRNKCNNTQPLVPVSVNPNDPALFDKSNLPIYNSGVTGHHKLQCRASNELSTDYQKSSPFNHVRRLVLGVDGVVCRERLA